MAPQIKVNQKAIPDIFFVAVRAFLGCLFIVSGFLKLIEPYQNFQAIIESYKVVSGPSAQTAALLLPWLEFILGVFLVLGLWIRASLLGLWALNTAFIFLLGSALFRRLPLQDCGCFGDLLSLSSAQMISIDSGLWLVFAALVRDGSRVSAFSLDNYFARKEGSSSTPSCYPSDFKRLLVFIFAVSVGVLLVLLIKPTTPAISADEILASVGHKKFYRGNLSDRVKEGLKSLEQTRYLALQDSAEEWASDVIFAKEAALKSKTTAQFLNDEIGSKIAVGDAEVFTRFARSPQADRFPYDQAIEKIRSGLKNNAFLAAKRKWVRSLYKKYNVNFFFHAPEGIVESLPDTLSQEFPVYSTLPTGPDIVQGSVVGPPYLGSAQAPVVFEIFSDFMCPFSARFSHTTRAVHDQYKDTVRIEYRHFPLPFHVGADQIAEASVCAQEQGKFWQFHDAMYADSQTKEVSAIPQVAVAVGLDQKKFMECLSSGKYRSRVQEEIQEGTKKGVRGTPTFFLNGRMGSGALPVEAVKPVIEWMLNPSQPPPASGRQDAKPPSNPQANAGEPNAQKTYEFGEAELKDAPTRGPGSAPVTIIEFSDFNCPFCNQGAATMNQIMQKFNGQVRLVSKQFPLPMHPNAQSAAMAALCANEQGKYWEFHDKIFGDGWGKQSKDDLKSFAKELGLNTDSFNRCLDEEKYKKMVEADTALGQKNGVTGTPSYFINGTLLAGARPPADFETLINEKLQHPKKT